MKKEKEKEYFGKFNCPLINLFFYSNSIYICLLNIISYKCLEGAFNINLCGCYVFVTCVVLVCEEDCILMD